MMQEAPGGFCFICDRPYTEMGRDHQKNKHPDLDEAMRQLAKAKGPEESMYYKIWRASRDIQEITRRPIYSRFG